MTKTTLKVSALAAVLFAVGASSLGARGASGAKDATLEALAGYRQWERVKGEPSQVRIVPGEFVTPDASAIQL
jgi:hypothetical protein